MNFYDSIIEGAQELSAQERGQLYTAVLEYLYYGKVPDFKMKPAPKAIFQSMRPVFDNQRAKAEAGRLGGKAQSKSNENKEQTRSKSKAKPKANAKQKQSKTQSNSLSKLKAETLANEKQNASEQEQEQKEETTANAVAKRVRFVPPSPEEVDAYILEKGYSGFDGEGFCAFYASKGWKVGSQPMKDWRKACTTWQKRREAKRFTSKGGEDGFGDFKI